MNKVTFICLLLLITTLKANAQSYKITYGKLNTSTLEDLEQITNIGVKNNIISIKTYPLDKILDEYIPTNKTIDFFSIDVEGFELKVLKSKN